MNNIIDYSRIGEAADQLIQDIRNAMEAQGINASGSLSRSLSWGIIGDEGGMHLVVSADSYWDYAMRGRGPGKVPYDFKEILKQWIISKNISFSGTIDQFAGSIMYTIRNFGSKRYREGNEVDVVSIPINNFMESVGNNLIMKDEIVNRIVGEY